MEMTVVQPIPIPTTKVQITDILTTAIREIPMLTDIPIQVTAVYQTVLQIAMDIQTSATAVLQVITDIQATMTAVLLQEATVMLSRLHQAAAAI